MANEKRTRSGAMRLEQTIQANVHAFLEAAPDALIVVGRDGYILLVNGQAETLFGYARSELVGQPIEVLIPERHRDGHPLHRAGYFDAPRRRPIGVGVDLRARRRDGSEFPAEISLGPVDTPEGLLAVATVRDVTERKKMEAQRDELARIVDSSHDAIIGNTLDGIVRSWNAGARHVFGYSAEEMIGQSISVLLPPGHEHEEPAIIDRLARGERVEAFETVRRRKTGESIDVSVTISPIRDAAGQVVGASRVARDISDRKRTERKLTRAREATEAANRELEAFSYSVAHDLRAPLRGIDGFSQAILEDYGDKLDAEGQHYLRRVRESAQQMAQLIDGLLSLAKIGRGDTRRDYVTLGEIARRVAERLKEDEPERNVEFRLAQGLMTIGDARLLRIALENLFGNAWKFTRQKEQAIIELGCTRKDNVVVFFVRDNGVGFDPAYATKLFGVFQRLHTQEEFEGTGVGLATVQRIIRRHSGRIWAESAVGEGATFYFTLNEKESRE